MLSSSRDEEGSPSERAKMYSEVPHEEDALHEKDDLAEEYTVLQRNCLVLEHRLRNLRIWIYSLIALLVICFTLLLLSLGIKPKPMESVSRYVTPVPQLPVKPVTFQEYDIFANHSNPNSDEAWSRLMPKGDGFVVVQNPEKYGLQPGKNSSNGPLYDISVFHQLHCLRHIRVYMYTLFDNARDGVETEAFQKFLQNPDEHAFHCFDYIRQALMCNADMTVEWPREEVDGSRFAVDGWGIDHQCKDWDSVMDWMEENRLHQPWEKDTQA